MGPGSERLVDCAYCGCAAEGVVLIAQTDYLGGPGNAWDGGGDGENRGMGVGEGVAGTYCQPQMLWQGQGLGFRVHI